MFQADFGIFENFCVEKFAVFKGVFLRTEGRTEVGQRVRPLSQNSHFLGQRGGGLCPTLSGTLSALFYKGLRAPGQSGQSIKKD